MELDHVFVCAEEADATLLTAAGLTCGINRVHTAQGTSNASFYFDNAYLELLFLRDEVEVRSPAVAPLRLWERLRWRETGACPFGVAYRTNHPPRAMWQYAAPFLPSGLTIPILSPRDATEEPLVFISPGAVAPIDHPTRFPLEHGGRRRRLNSIQVQAGPHHLVLEFETQSKPETLDFRPALPLTIRW